MRRFVPCCVTASALVACLSLVAKADNPGVAWRTNLDAAKLEAAQSGRLILLHFTTKTCGPCRLLDKQVFSQPQVGQAVEQDYVPVRIDADASPALARMYRIKVVPTEVIASPDGNPLFTPQIPNSPEPYVTQLQNLARHYRQTTGGGRVESSEPAINPAYAALPTPQQTLANPYVVGGATAPQSTSPPRTAPMVQSPPPSNGPAVQPNLYTNSAPDPSRYGQAQSVYDSPQATTDPNASPPAQQQQPATAAQPHGVADAAGTPVGGTQQIYQTAMQQQSTIAQQSAASPNIQPNAAASPAFDGGSAPSKPAADYPSTDAALASSAAAASSSAAVSAGAAGGSKIELPPGSPPVGLEGYCPVTLKTLTKWTRGNVQYGVVHRGRTYLFAGPEQRDQFLADPDAYSPVFAGMDPVLLIDRQESVEGSRSFGYQYGGSLYLFAGKESMQKFAATPHAYAAGVRQAMNRIDSGGTLRR